MFAKFFFLGLLVPVTLSTVDDIGEYDWSQLVIPNTKNSLITYTLSKHAMEILNYNVVVVHNCSNSTPPHINAQIVFKNLEETDYILFHKSLDMLFSKAELRQENQEKIDTEMTNTYYMGEELLHISSEVSLEKNKIYRLDVWYRSRLQNYIDRKCNAVILATTHPGINHARTFIPCWDEPRFKATFNVTVVYPQEYELAGITSSHLLDVDVNQFRGPFQPLCSKLKISKLEVTPEIPPHLFSFIVAKDYSCSRGQVDGRNINFSVCARNEFSNSRKVAFDFGKKILSTLHNFVKYQGDIVENLSQFAVPSEVLAEGTMGSFQLKIYPESDMLYNYEHSSNFQKQKVILAVARGLADLWFNNKILSLDWTQNKGMPTYLSYLIPNMIDPSLELDRQFSVDYVQESLFVSPCEQDYLAKKMKDVGNFLKLDRKSACMFQMLHYMVQTPLFGTLIQNYVQKNEETTLFDYLYTEIPNISNYVEELFNYFMDSYRHKGYPVVFVSDIVDAFVNVSQKKNFWDCTYLNTTETFEWTVPITYTTSVDRKKFANTKADFTLQLKDLREDTIPVKYESEWIMLNNQQKGYYRVMYHDKLFAKILHALQKDGFDGIHELNRAQFIDDYYFFYCEDKIELDDITVLFSFLKNDSSYYPWKTAFRAFQHMLRHIPYFGSTKELFKARVRDLMKTVYNSVSFHEEKPYNHMYSLKRSMVIMNACLFGVNHCIYHAKKELNNYITTNRKPNRNLRSTIYCYGLLYTSDVTSSWEFLWKEFKQTKSEEEKLNILEGLSCITDAELLERYLYMIVFESEKHRLGNPFERFRMVCDSSVDAVTAARNFIVNNSKTLYDEDAESLLEYTKILNDHFIHWDQKFRSSELPQEIMESEDEDYQFGLKKMKMTFNYVSRLTESLSRHLED